MPRLTASQLRQRTEWDVEIEDGYTVRVRRIDFVQAYMQNLIPLPLVAALDRLIQNGKDIIANPEKAADLSDEDRAQTVELLQRYACAAIIDPIFTMEDDGHPEHCCVKMLTSDHLLKIWRSRPQIAVAVQEATADYFRHRPDVPDEAPADVPDGGEVPPTTVVVSDSVVAEGRFT